MNVTPLCLGHARTACSPWAPAETTAPAVPRASDAVTLGPTEGAPATATTADAHEARAANRGTRAVAWKAAAIALLTATPLLGAAGQAVAATPEAVPAPAQTTLLTPHQQRAARQGADLVQKTSTAVTNAVVDAANRLAAQNPDRPVTIHIRDITVTVVGFDDFIDATQNNAPSDGGTPATGERDKGAASHTTGGAPAAPTAPADGGGEIIHRTFDFRKGDLRIRATENLRPTEPTCPAPPSPSPALR